MPSRSPDNEPDSQNTRPTGQLPDTGQLQQAFLKLCEVIARLRSPEGCPWDRVQTLESIKPYTLEETYELLEAIDGGDDGEIVEELGDLLLQVVLDAQIGHDEGRFSLLDVLRGITDKMIRRHPHVFGDAQASTAADVVSHWDHAKRQEKAQRQSVLDGIPADLPALARAARITKKAARVGYDFPDRAMLFDKLREEIDELARELFADGCIPQIAATVEADVIADEPLTDLELAARVEGEIGDMLFVIANIARRWNVNPEEALRKSNQKFARRFRYIEEQLAARGKDIREASLLEMEALYQEGKREEGR